MIAILAAVLALSLAVTYATLRRNAEVSARERLAGTIRVVASTMESAVRMRQRALQAPSRDPRLLDALAAPRDSAAIRRATDAIAAHLSPSDTAFSTELRDLEGHRIAFVAADLPPAVRAHAPLVRLEGPGTTRPDSALAGEMFRWGDRAYFWIGVPVRRAGQLAGSLMQLRRVGGSPNANRSLRSLTGHEVTLFMRNARGDVWLLAPGKPDSAPARSISSLGVTHDRGNLGQFLVVEAPVSRTPWVAALEAPLSAVRAPARQTVLVLALVSVVLIALGGATAWRMGRHITAPLAAVTRAAEAMAMGERAEIIGVNSEDEIGRLARRFNEMAQEVERRVADALQARRDAESAREDAEHANRAKSDFLAVMSHELRTPLNAIGGYAQLMAMGLHGPVTPEQRDALERIERSQSRLLALINDVLNFAKLDAGQVSYHITDVAIDEALNGAETMVAPQVRARELRFRYEGCDTKVTARADRDKLGQVVLNLLSNAVKYTLPGGEVVLACDVRPDEVVISVRDTGVGIAEARLSGIFEPFVQAHRALNNPGEGVGLGLAISRDLARAMHGEITVTSTVGRGSTFTLTLPRGADLGSGHAPVAEGRAAALVQR